VFREPNATQPDVAESSSSSESEIDQQQPDDAADDGDEGEGDSSSNESEAAGSTTSISSSSDNIETRCYKNPYILFIIQYEQFFVNCNKVLMLMSKITAERSAQYLHCSDFEGFFTTFSLSRLWKFCYISFFTTTYSPSNEVRSACILTTF
jgi:hypothetical protein